MTDRFAPRRPGDQLLGEIATEIIASKRPIPAIRPGDKVYIEPGHAALQGPHTVIVENSDAELLGHLPEKLVDWLGPLLANGTIRLEGYVPVETPPPGETANRRAIVLTVYQTDGSNLLNPITPVDEFQAIHEVVRYTYCLAQRFPKPEMIRRAARLLRRLQREPLLPETRLLLAMLPGLIRELHACHGVDSILELRNSLASLEIGAAVQWEGLTFFPLLWPDDAQPPFITLDAALTSGEATVKERAATTRQETTLIVANRGERPLLVCDGEVVYSTSVQGVVSCTVLIAAGAEMAPPLYSQDEWRLRRAGRKNSTAPISPRPPKLDARAAGVAAACAGRVIGIDLFATPAVFEGAWGALADAYPLRTLVAAPVAADVSRDDVRKFIEHIAGAARPRSPELGIGCEMEIAGEHLVGRALLYEGRVCHLTALGLGF